MKRRRSFLNNSSDYMDNKRGKVQHENGWDRGGRTPSNRGGTRGGKASNDGGGRGPTNQAKVAPHPWIGPLPSGATSELVLLNDEQVKEFLFNGYLILKPQLPRDFDQFILSRFAEDPSLIKAGNNILPCLPALNLVYEDKVVKGALTSLLGNNYIMHPHRAVHFNPPGFKSQRWHRDTFWGYGRNYRFNKIRYVMAMYYPQKTTLDMGPTGLKPGTQYYTIDPKFYQGDQINHFSKDNANYDKPGVVEAGAVILIHYDIIHKGMENLSSKDRLMFKFQFMRMEEPTAPSWNCLSRNWDVGLRAAQSQHMKALEPVCKCIWIWLCGGNTNNDSNNSSTSTTTTITITTTSTTTTTTTNSTTSTDNTVTAQLTAQLDSPNEWDRVEAAFSLSLNGNLNILLDRMDANDEQLAINASMAVCATPHTSVAVYLLLKMLKTSHSEKMISSIVYTLGQLGAHSVIAIKDIVDALKITDNMWVHYHGCEALGIIGSCTQQLDQSVIELLSRELSSTHDRVRFTAGMALAQLGEKAAPAIPHLYKALSDYNRYVEAYALLALKRIPTPEAQKILVDFLWASRFCPLTTPSLTF